MKNTDAKNSFEQIFHRLIVDEREQRSSVNHIDKALIEAGILAGLCQSTVSFDVLWTRLLKQDILTVQQCEDLVIHIASYVGFIKAKAVMDTLKSVLKRDSRMHELPPADATTANMGFTERSDHGMKAYAILDAPRVPEQLKFYSAISEDYYRALMGVFGVTFDRPSLNVRQREIVTVAVLCALGHCPKQLLFHTRVAMEQGVEKNVLVEILMSTQLLAGSPVANNAAAVMRELFI